MTESTAKNGYPTTPVVRKGELPDLFARPDGTRLAGPAEWPAQAQRWRELVAEIAYGGLPPPPDELQTELLCLATLGHWPSVPQLRSYRISCLVGGGSLSFAVQILYPAAPGPHPALINGDGCWWYLTADVAQRLVGRGCAVVMFDRTQLAADLGYEGAPDKQSRQGGIYDLYPQHPCGALAAWAWGYHRCVDLLLTLPQIDAARIGITGHSRGGKTVLLAGVTDARIGLVNDNASCAGGSAVFRYVGDGGETIDIVNRYPSWFGPQLGAYDGREEALPFDQHCLLAAIAPRPLLITYALDDRWSNPEGMVQSAWAAGQAYQLLDATDNLAFHLRAGNHAHAQEDWAVLVDFVGWKWFGGAPAAAYNAHPYAHLRPAFSWRAPPT